MAKKTTTYYNFLAHSSLSFKVLHKGRNMIIRFSTPYNSASRFMTTDKGLADKIMEHRWFRKGIITLQKEVVEEKQVIEEDQSPAIPTAKKPNYTIGKMKMGSAIPPQALRAGSKTAPKEVADITVREADDTGEEGVITDGNTDTGEEGAVEGTDSGAIEESELTLESVESFLEAREYLAKVHGVDISKVRSKTKVAEVCAELGIEFPNFQPQ